MADKPINDAEFEKLVAEGIEAKEAGEAASWKLGDLAVQVTERYSRDEERSLPKYADSIDVPYSTLHGFKRVAERFPESSGRRQLSFSHHQAVVARKDADELLAKAEAEGWSYRQLLVELGRGSDSKSRVVNPQRWSLEESAQVALEAIQKAVAQAQREFDPEARFRLLQDFLGKPIEDLRELIWNEWNDYFWEHRISPEDKARAEAQMARFAAERKEARL